MRNTLTYISILVLISFNISCKNEKENNSISKETVLEFGKDFYTEVGACPFEGCMYGQWSTKGNIKILKEPKLKSAIIGEIPANKKFKALNGKIEIVPGIAFKIKDLPSIGYTESEISKIDYDQPIYVLHYVGEGFRKVNQNNEFSYLQFPSDEKIFNEYKSNYDWLRIEKYPTDFKWWVEVEFLDIKGWILVDSEVIPLDRFA